MAARVEVPVAAGLLPALPAEEPEALAGVQSDHPELAVGQPAEPSIPESDGGPAGMLALAPA